MRATLRIGEVAQLLGVTPKTIRYYQRIGLIAAPTRSPSGYRQYTAADLVTLLRVRRLQALGLSLAQVRRVLGEPDHQRTLREALEQLLADTVTRREALEAREQRIRRLLAEESLDAIEQPYDQPAILQWAQERFAERMGPISPSLWEADAKIFGTLEALRWPDGSDLPLREALERFLQQSDDTFYQRLLLFAEGLAALADQPEDSPAVERLVEMARQSEIAPYLASASPDATVGLDDAFGAVMAEVTLSVLSPAQRRFMRLMRDDAAQDTYASDARKGGNDVQQG